ncbi:MAG: glycosyltransferase family 2 protein [candidate division NC10 bacterium]|nr:glycosyltransferase family 2 protein [candidate division NC10 bacterium]MDE2321239.1 glycosyltransferase family 2 protein [candidate division NC10 bacterium]
MTTYNAAHGADPPCVTVIAVNWNGKELLAACFQALRQQTFRDFEILLVDNGSTDGSVEFVTAGFPEVDVIALDENLGFSAANNIGIRHARGGYIALLNSDTEVEPRWLEELVNALDARPEIGFCASKMLLWQTREIADTCGDFYTVEGIAGKIGHLEHAAQYNQPREVFGACAGAAIYRKSMLDDIGLLDEDFFLAHEDTDLSFRAQLMGYKCLYVPTAIVYHHLSATIGADSNTYIYYGHRNNEYVYIKNMPLLLLLKYWPWHLLFDFLLLLFFFPRGKALPFLKAKGAALRGFPRMLKKRRQIQRACRVSTRDIERTLIKGWLFSALRRKLMRVAQDLSWFAKREFYHVARRYLPPPVKRWFLNVDFVRERIQPKPPLAVERAEAYLQALRARRLLDQGAGALNGRMAAGGHTTKASIVMLTKNRLALTQLCLESILCYTDDSHLEIIVVDNASTDGTRSYVGQLARQWPAIQLICNDRNEGFARATNQGIQKARGDYIVLLNNDTIVTRGWLSRLLRYLEQNPNVGMVGPVTNDAANEQMIAVGYTSLEELEVFAEERYRRWEGRAFEIAMLQMFCVAMRRSLVDQIGLLDEQFGLGTFEDDDYAHRVRQGGYTLLCAEDVFTHHFGRGTMRRLQEDTYFKLFDGNRRLFERKWGVHWRPHRLRSL